MDVERKYTHLEKNLIAAARAEVAAAHHGYGDMQHKDLAAKLSSTCTR